LAARGEGVWWAPRRGGWWIGVLFAIGSTCFLVGPIPGLVELVGSEIDALIFFVGSIFFTSAAALQLLQSTRAGWFSTDWWASAIQFVGTLYFNVDTFRALQQGLDATEYDRLVWTPDTIGSACFLVSGFLAYGLVRGRGRTLDWKIGAVNLVGCIAFGISALAAFWVPTNGSIVHLAAANFFTAFGGLCFLVGAVLLLPLSARQASSAR
jgi:hypothetical protein